jgi:hypothetical protein
MAEEPVMEGDLVCILFGCSIPVVLREVSVTLSISAMVCCGLYAWKGNRGVGEGKFQPRMFEAH